MRCLLVKTFEELAVANAPLSLARWEPWFQSVGLDFNLYHDAGEILQRIVTALDLPAWSDLTAVHLSDTAERFCGEHGAVEEPTQKLSVHPFLSVGLDQELPLQDVVNTKLLPELLAPDRSDVPLCGFCQERLSCRTQTSAGPFLFVEVNRLPPASGIPLASLASLRLKGVDYVLRAASTLCGQHFVAHVKGHDMVKTFDDAHVVVRPDWPAVVATHCKLLLFVAPSSGCELQPGSLHSLPDATVTADLSTDVVTLLRLYSGAGDPVSFLSSLPLFAASGLCHENLPKCLEAECDMLVREQINAAAALECRFAFADTMLYPLAVLLQATAVSVGMPSIFYVDVVLGLVNSLFERHLAVDLKRFPTASRNRYWVASVANVGEGKSPATAPIVGLLQEVLAKHPHLLPGVAADRFHYQQGSTSAFARDKLRACDGYLTVYSDEAGPCLSAKYASGGDIDPYKHIDLGLFLNAAHGGEFDFATLRERLQVVGRKKSCDPKGAVPMEEGLQLNPTNVHFLFLQQEYYFNHFWAQLAADKPVGLAHRFLFSFGAYENPPPNNLSGFFASVAAPILRRLFELVLLRFGPKVVAASDLVFSVSAAQSASIGAIHELVTAFKRRETSVAQPLRLAMPKRMYWLATALMTTHVLEQLWPFVFSSSMPSKYTTEIGDACFFSACRFLHRRFLRGHAILSVNAREQSWLPQRVVRQSQDEAFFLRVLRGSSNQVLSVENCCVCDLDFKRAWHENPESLRLRLQNFWQLCEDVGLGCLCAGDCPQDVGATTLKKFHLSTLQVSAREWLLRHRVPLENWNFLIPENASVACSSPVAVLASPVGVAVPSVAAPSVSVVALPDAPGHTDSVENASVACSSPVAVSASPVCVAVPSLAAPSMSVVTLPDAPGHTDSADARGGLSVSPVSVPSDVKDVPSASNVPRAPRCPSHFVAAVPLGMPLKTKPEVKAALLNHSACAAFRNRVHLTKADLVKWCFRVECAEAVGCPYVILATYFLQRRGHVAGTLLLSSLREHSHTDGHPTNSGKIFTNQQLSAANAFCAESHVTAIALCDHLAHVCPGSKLPTRVQVANWLKRRRGLEKVERLDAPPAHRDEAVVGVVESRLESWYPIPVSVSGLYVLSQGVLISDTETFIPFACPGMVATLSRYKPLHVLLGLDAKEKVLERGMSVLTLSLLGKAGLRNTRMPGRKQLRACVTRAFPVLQAIISGESADNAGRAFTLLSKLWHETHQDSRPSLADSVVQVHKDFAPGFEAARRKHFPKSRPCDDYFHLRQKHKALESRLSTTHVHKGCFVKTHLGWLRACLDAVRLLPTLQLFHFCWQGLLVRLRSKGEDVVADYLAHQYTQALPERFVQQGHDAESWFASFLVWL